MKRSAFCATVAWMLAAPACLAHESLPASLTLTQVQAQDYDVDWRLPALEGRAPAITPRFPDGCKADSAPIERSAPGARVLHWRLRCVHDLALGVRIEFDGLQASVVNVLAQLVMADGRHWSALASGRSPSLELGKAEGQLDVGGYFALGVSHILSGVDHLLFVLCLVLLVPGRMALLRTVSAFTLAHSATLALAALGVLHVPQAPVEASIALSIVFLARELARPAGATLARRWPALLAFGFGLLHGLGFAGALAEVGLPAGDIPLALLLFNLGVEAGQLAFVLVVSVLLLGWRRSTSLRLERLCAYGVGGVAAFWTLQRLVPILGLA
ncbi:MAG: HupE/UreJ family protein [Pseudomonadota bacterium]